MNAKPKQLEFILVERDGLLESHRLAMAAALRVLKRCREEGSTHLRNDAVYAYRLLRKELGVAA